MSYLGNSPGVASQRIVTTFTATAGQTTFTPSSGYALGYCDVFQNGVKLVNGDDYTASNGTTVVLASGANAGDSVEVVAYIPRGLSDGYTKAEADTLLNAKQNSLGYTPVNKAGDTMTGPLKVARGAEGKRDAFQLHVAGGITDGNYDAITWWQGASTGVNDAPLGSLRGVYTSAGRGELEWWSRPEIEKVGGSPYFRVDQHGRVTMPYQPAFRAVKGNNDVYASSVEVKYSSTPLNQGNHFNQSTGRFTAPVSGVYFFAFQGLTHDVTNYFYFEISINNQSGSTGIVGHLPVTDGVYMVCGASGTIRMNAGDFVSVKQSFNGGSPYFEGRTAFSGYLIG